MSESGPAGTMADVQEATSSAQISIYVVRQGDSLAEIANMFGVSKNTILWANNLKSANDIHPNDTLVILPVSGVQHTVVKGETIASIVKKYRGDMQDVLDYNGLSAGVKLAVGDVVIIPDGIDGPAAPTPGTVKSTGAKSSVASGSVSSYERLLPGYGGAAIPGYYLRPLSGGIKTQGLHGYNAVDIGTHVGTPVFASCPGTVMVSRGSGYNGGYGDYIVIQCSNGTQTLYGHLSKVSVGAGETVDRGDSIALSGNTGRSTGAHLHFEVRGAANPF
jgi:murein DD-endopeptidase MepM/ murein hydrolase activator NlpD